MSNLFSSLFGWITPTAWTVLFACFVLHNLIDKYLARIEATLSKISGELDAIRSLNGSSGQAVVEALSPVENILGTIEMKISDINGQLDTIRRVAIAKAIKEALQDEKTD
jgi:hypothetical protein